MRACELSVGASRSRLDDVERSTTEGTGNSANTTDVSLLLMERVPRNGTRQCVDHRRYAPQVCFTSTFSYM